MADFAKLIERVDLAELVHTYGIVLVSALMMSVIDSKFHEAIKRAVDRQWTLGISGLYCSQNTTLMGLSILLLSLGTCFLYMIHREALLISVRNPILPDVEAVFGGVPGFSFFMLSIVGVGAWVNWRIGEHIIQSEMDSRRPLERRHFKVVFHHDDNGREVAYSEEPLELRSRAHDALVRYDDKLVVLRTLEPHFINLRVARFLLASLTTSIWAFIILLLSGGYAR